MTLQNYSHIFLTPISCNLAVFFARKTMCKIKPEPSINNPKNFSQNLP